MIYFDTYATIWEVEDKGKFSRVKFSTYRKDKESGAYTNSYWYASFFGDAHDALAALDAGTRVKLKGRFNNEPYYNRDGEKVYRKSPGIDVYQADIEDRSDFSGGLDTPPGEVRAGDLPF